ncbi:ent-kaurenoic acid oxidase 2-like [Pistacia vera]|uniref:ent-kaurenoic acid oxidase 2-like n=1 Tax=Pistacia vera TaxID=55513 RepID=UPI0012638057|nr:ent-kaurenoic acid oxidase 2-like [Pistacia vera]
MVKGGKAVAVHGKAHARLRSYVSNALNRPDALRHITTVVQPRMVAALQSWAEKGRLKLYDEAKKVTFENIGKLFVSFERGPVSETMDKLFEGLVHGIRAQPFNFPGTAYHHAIQCRRKLETIFRVEAELEKKKKKNGNEVETTNDLMDGLMQIEDDEGKKLNDQEVLDSIISLVPNVLQKLREENMAIRKNKKGDFITGEDVSKLKYTSKVMYISVMSRKMKG